MPKHSLARTAIASILTATTSQSQEIFDLQPHEVFAEKRLIDQSAASDQSPFALDLEFLTVPDISESLSDYPGYSAFRRTSARAAHPTTQGVRIRNLGANASSRALVTMDGLPINDPFGGWVYWHRINPQSLRFASISTHGSSEAWGNYGAGGSISLISKNQRQTSGEWLLGFGSDSSYNAALHHSQKLDDQLYIDFSTRVYETDGFEIVDPAQRGIQDIKADSSAYSARTQMRWGIDTPWSLKTVIDYFSEERTNGTPLGLNETDALDFSLQYTREIEGEDKYWSLSLYHQTRDFANVFTSVRDNRTTERPALDQFDVPADAFGGSFSYFSGRENSSFLAGIDFRQADAEVHERFRNLGSGFERQRDAGGEQSFIGAFARSQHRINETDTLSLTARVDQIEQKNGFRSEFDLADGNIRRNDLYASSSDAEYSFNGTYSRAFDSQTTGSLSIFSGFRSPTLNEFYRPFRVVNDITESNPLLSNERHSGIEASFTIDDQNGLTVTGSVFHYRIQDMVANVLLSTEAGFDPLCGFVPSGGSCSQRFNLERSELTGAEFSVSQSLTEQVDAGIQYVYTKTEITRSSASLQVVGNQFAHSSPHRLNAYVDWNNDHGWYTRLKASVWDDEYEDIENSRVIDGEILFDAQIQYEIGLNNRLTLDLENLLDTTIQTGLSTNGLVRIGAPFTATLSFSRLY
ncbi:MAG: TonB-dependent receptor plug domain-containing protein [Verrucomicrobiota bacterium]